MSQLRTLLAARRGVATVEFALTSLLMFGVIVVALDFAFYAQQKLRLGAAIEQAAILAYNRQVTNNTSIVSAYVQAAARTATTPAVTITCNGTTSCGDGKCSCLTSTGGFSIVAACNTACGGSASAISGNYMKIVGSLNYASMVVPNRYLGGTTMTQAAVVRLQ